MAPWSRHPIRASACSVVSRPPTSAITTHDIFEPGVPQNSNNIFADKGPTLRDARHRFVLSGIVRLPLGIETSNIVALQSGRPYNITTGTDDNGDGHFKDRPPGVGRNAGRAAPTYVWDTRLSRPFKIGERVEISPTVDMFNVVNHPNFDPESYNGVISSPTFGKPFLRHASCSSACGPHSRIYDCRHSIDDSQGQNHTRQKQ